jgi:hypothetical protein
MNHKVFRSILTGAAILIPLLLGGLGYGSWAGGLGLGELLGLGSFFWIRWSVQKALTPDKSGNNPFALLGHSLLRLSALGLVFFIVLKFPALSIWAALIGYTLIQLPAAVWQRTSAGERKLRIDS